MDRVFVLLKRKPGLSFDQFRDHYERSHVALAERLFGHLFASYRRNYVPQGHRFSDGADVENAYDCVTELVFRDTDGYAELLRIVSRPEVGALLRADEERFLDRARCMNAVPEAIEERAASQPPSQVAASSSATSS